MTSDNQKWVVASQPQWTGGSGNHPSMGIIGVASPNAGNDAYSGVNANGETTGVNGNNNGNNTNIKTPNATTNQSQGTKSAAEFNNSNNNSNVKTNTITPK